jgi:Flp pilus assembly pilin Flp
MKLECGQGLVEYALIAVLLLVVITIMGSVLFPTVFGAVKPISTPNLEQQVQLTLDAYEQWVDTCVAQERYDRATCEQLELQQD